ncbi:pyridine nucleotide-disulfide oxidoreductase [Paenarthrobacter nitroguajacolicus]|nr:pyridine nucleotide-disulfide oxidoreductase [Paenarthrobacter nitroguajacolicus]
MPAVLFDCARRRAHCLRTRDPILMSAGCIVIGGGHAGISCATSLRDEGYTGPITVIDTFVGLPYERPPLSKDYLLGLATLDQLVIRSSEFYKLADIRVLTDSKVLTIDRTTRTAEVLSRGLPMLLEYEYLIFATGSVPRGLDVPGAELQGVHRLADANDAKSLAEALTNSENVVIIGAGFIGLECAVATYKLGHSPVVLNLDSGVLARVASQPTADFVDSWHRSSGARFLHGTSVSEIVGEDGHVTAVKDDSGNVHAADTVIVGIGALPRTELAKSAGLDVDRGILVDEFLRTSDPAIFAIGDCARYKSSRTNELMRLESVQNATDHGRAVAATIAGRPRKYEAIPWFWSDQGALKLQIAGINAGATDYIVRGDVAEGKFSVFCYQDEKLLAVDSIGKPADHIQARKLLAARVSPTHDQAADSNFPLKSLIAK